MRTVEVDGTDFLINGQPFYFRGFGMHEDHAIRGKATTTSRWSTTSRCCAGSAPTPSAPPTTRTPRRCWITPTAHGVVVIDETAAVGMNSSVAAVSSARASFKMFSPETVNEVTQQAHAQAIRELFARDKNHPCVVIWSFGQRAGVLTPESRDYFEPLAARGARARPEPPDRVRQRHDSRPRTST